MKRFWGVIVLTLAACTHSSPYHQDLTPVPERATLLVESDGGSFALRINGMRFGTAIGTRSCVFLPRISGMVQIEVDPTDGGWPLFTPPEDLSSRLHWKLKLGLYPTIFDMLSMAPATESCK